MTKYHFSLLMVFGVLILIGGLSLILASPLHLTAVDGWHALSGHDSNLKTLVVTELRLPRFIIAALAGIALTYAGAIMQAITANPIASPSLFGINSAANLGFVLATLFPILPENIPAQLAAIIAASVCWLFINYLARTGRCQSMLKLILIGTAISALCSAITRALLLFFESQNHALLSQMAGNLAGLRTAELYQMAWVIIPLVLITQGVSHQLNILRLGQRQAESLGLNVPCWNLGLSLIVLILVATVVSFCGQFAFIGLMIPHLARFWCGVDHRKMLPMAGLLGGLLLALADLLGRIAHFPAETPAGAITALIGAPAFLYWVRRL